MTAATSMLCGQRVRAGLDNPVHSQMNLLVEGDIDLSPELHRRA